MVNMSGCESTAAYRSRRKAILRRLGRVNAAVTQWRKIAMNEQLPDEFRRRLPRPALLPEAYEELRHMLMEELAGLEAATPPKPPDEGPTAHSRAQHGE